MTHAVIQTDLDAGFDRQCRFGHRRVDRAAVQSRICPNEVLVPAVLVRSIETVKTRRWCRFATPGERVGYMITVSNTGK